VRVKACFSSLCFIRRSWSLACSSNWTLVVVGFCFIHLGTCAGGDMPALSLRA